MEADRFRVKRKTVQSVLEQCRRTLDQLQSPNFSPSSLTEDKETGGDFSPDSPTDADYHTDELCDLIKSKVESPYFLEKLGSIHMSVSHYSSDETASWDMVSAKDLWEDNHGDKASDQDDYVIVKQEDIVEGIACFIAAYLLSLEQAKELTPNQLQEVLSKTFSIKKKRSKLQKAWDGGKVIYNVASWSATAVGICQNPVFCRAASMAFWTSCRVISKLL